MEDSQKKADWLVAITSSSLLAAGSFLKQHLDWDGLITNTKDWTL